jgi:hypothetical protein
MPLKELQLRLIAIGEHADALCRKYPNHRCAVHLRDLHTQIAIAMLQMSESTRKRIARY